MFASDDLLEALGEIRLSGAVFCEPSTQKGGRTIRLQLLI